MSALEFSPNMSGSLQLVDAQFIAIMVQSMSIHSSALAKLLDSRPKGVRYVAAEGTDALPHNVSL